MKLKDMRELSATELATKIKETQEELANLKFQHSLHQLNDQVKVRLVRKELARMITIQKEETLGIPETRRAKVSGRE